MTDRPSFAVSELDYELPEDLIAQVPSARREDGRMLVVDRSTGALQDSGVLDLPDRLRAGDLLVVNNTRVVPAKFAFRRTTGGRIQGLFLEEIAPGEWVVMLDGIGRLRPGEAITTVGRSGRTVTMIVLERLESGRCRVQVEPFELAEAMLNDIGMAPLPPYIRRPASDVTAEDADRERYQTIYARRTGAVAAPTAGLHLTEGILQRVRAKGVEVAEVTLHVGLGTFQPIAVADLADHPMHSERFELPASAAEAIGRCRLAGGRVVAVGTTTVRVLESAAARGSPALPLPYSGETDLLLYPSSEFRMVDALLTNFHLPRSTLLALVMAFAGREATRKAYEHAKALRYRFYSFGDAMFIA